jgi:hypothetical protein
VKRPLTEAEAARAQELLLDRAMHGLDPAQAAELAALGADADESFDLAAAALDVATVRLEPMPAGVADRILAAASAALRSGGQAARVRDPGAPPGAPQTLAGVVPARTIHTSLPLAEPPAAPPPPWSAGPAEVPGPVPRPAPAPHAHAAQPGALVHLADRARERRRSRAPVIVAWLAAAACLALAVGAVLWARGRTTAPAVTAAPSPAEARAALLASAGDAATLAWQATADAAAQGASGDVVWSPSRQRGYMRFKGLAPNDPRISQYQLWIFDKARDERFPVDGGVFDVTSSGEVIVAISARLPIADAVLFAVTVEAPGGVVVSARERIVVTAAPARAG